MTPPWVWLLPLLCGAVAAGSLAGSSREHTQEYTFELPLADHLLSQLHASQPQQTKCHGFLQCWLASLRFVIPDIHVHKDGVSANITHLTCTGIALDAIHSHIVPGNDAAIAFDMSGIGVPCAGNFAFKFSFLKGGGVAHMKVLPSSTVAMTISLTSSGDPPMAVAAALSQCDLSLDLDLSVTGAGVLGALIDIVIAAFKSKLEAAVDKLLCSVISDLVATNATAILQDVDRGLLPIVAVNPSYPPKVSPSHYNPLGKELLDWRNISAFHALDEMLNGPKGFLNNSGLINCVMSYLTGHLGGLDQPGTVRIPFPAHNLTLVVPGIANLTVDLEWLQLEGLDSFTGVQLLHVPNYCPNALSTKIGLGALNVSLRTTIVVTPDDSSLSGSRLQETFDLAVAVEDVVLMADMLLAVSKSPLVNFTVAQLLNSSCLLSSIVSLNMTALDLNMTLLAINLVPRGQSTTGKFLEYFLDELVNNVVDLCTGHYSTLLSRVFRGALAGPVRDMLNTLSNAALSNAQGTQSCAEVSVPGGPKYLKWNESLLVGAIDLVVNELVGAGGLDAILMCADQHHPFIQPPWTADDLTSHLHPSSAWHNEGRMPLNQLTHLPPSIPRSPPFGTLMRMSSLRSVRAHSVHSALEWLGMSATVDSLHGSWRLPVHMAFMAPFAGSRKGKNVHLGAAVPGVDMHLNVRVVGWKSFYEFMVMHPMDQDTLRSRLGLAACDATTGIGACERLNITVQLDLHYHQIHTQLNMSMSMHNVSLALDLLAKLDVNALGRLPLKRLANGHLAGPCLESVFRNVKLTDFALIMGDLDADVALRGGGGEVRFNTSLHGHNFTEGVDGVIAQLRGLIEKVINGNLATVTRDSPYVCASQAIPEPPSSSAWPGPIVLVIIGCVLVLGVFVYCHKRSGAKMNEVPCCGTRDAHSWWWGCGLFSDPDSGNGGDADDEYHVRHATGDSQYRPLGGTRRKRGMRCTDSLVFHPMIPLYMRLLVLVTILGNIALFVSSNLSVGAEVAANITFGDEKLRLGSLFSFSLANSVRDMWQAGVYPLAILIAVFSGGWPYLKLVLMLLAWVGPRRVVPLKTRESMLVWLDRLGKWSLIDTYVMVMFMVAFRLHIGLDDGIVSVDVLVIPRWGIYSFVLATMMSLALSHILLGYHRHVTTKHVIHSGGTAEALCAHPHRVRVPLDMWSQQPLPRVSSKYSELDDEDNRKLEQAELGGSGSGLISPALLSRSNSVASSVASGTRLTRVRCTSFGQCLVVLMVVISMALLTIGVIIYTFAFKFEGLAGLVLGAKSESEYSLVKLGIQLPSSSPDPDAFAIRWMQVVFFTFALAMPALYLLVLLLLWVVPLTLQRQRMLLVLSEVSYAWAALEVFIISIIASVGEISQFAQFIVGDKCDAINEVLAVLLNGPLHGEDKCFALVALFRPGVWVLFAASLILQLAGYLLGNVNAAAVEDRVRAYNKRRGSIPPITENRSRRESQQRPGDHVGGDEDALLQDQQLLPASEIGSVPASPSVSPPQSSPDLYDSDEDLGNSLADVRRPSEDSACQRSCDRCRIRSNMRVYRCLARMRVLDLGGAA